MKDERGLPIFEVLEARAACAECIEKLEDPSQCPHMQLERPKWCAFVFWGVNKFACVSGKVKKNSKW